MSEFKRLNLKPTYPNGYEERDGKIYGKGVQITEGVLRIHQLYECFSECGRSERYVEVGFIGSDVDEKTDIPYSELLGGHIRKYIPTNFRVLTVMDRKLEMAMCQAILGRLAGLPICTQYELHQGFNVLSDRVVYLAGDKIINNSSDYHFRYDVPYAFKSYAETPEYKAWLDVFLKAENFPPALFIAALVPIILPLVPEEKRSRYEFTTCLVGETGTGKTEIAKLLTGWFCEANGNSTSCVNMMSLSSNIDDLSSLSEFRDCCVLVDDLNKSDSYEDCKRKKKSLARIIESKQGAGSVMRKGKNVKFNAMIFVTAEYFLRSASLINRSLIVNIEDPFIPKELRCMQDNHDMYLSIIYHFIEYICSNFYELKQMVAEKLDSYKYRSKKSRKYKGWFRVSNIRFIMYTALDIFMEFYDGYIEDDIPEIYNSRKQTIRQSIDECVDDMLGSLNKDEDEQKLEYIDLFIRVLVECEQNCVSRNVDKFVENNKNNNLPKKFVYYDVSKNQYYVRATYLEQLFGGKMSSSDIIGLLDTYGLIRTNKSEKTFSALKSKNCNRRFICLYADEVEKYYKEYLEES